MTQAHDQAKESQEDPQEQTSGAVKVARDIALSVLLAVVLALFIKALVFQTYYIPSGSMLNTLQLGDRIIVEKVSFAFSDPERGDIVVFRNPKYPPDTLLDLPAAAESLGVSLGFVTPETDKDLIKRVIGLPGDTVEIRNGITFINGTQINEPYIINDPNSYGPYHVPEGHYFMMGDNRANSLDSRFSLGPVPRGHMIGHARAIVWPRSQMTTDLDKNYPELEEKTGN